MLNEIIEIAKKAGEIIKKAYHQKTTNIKYKGDVDLVTETDLMSEKLIIEHVRRYFPEDAIISEERDIINADAKRKWIIDPLDGTTNFSHRYPFCAVSIGVEENNLMKYGVVYNPILNELFFAELGKGAFLNYENIFVSKTDKMSNAIIGTGFPYDRWEKGEFYIQEYLAFTKKCQGVRRAGAAAIDLCYVATGRLDGFFERKLKPWDMAAGSLIVKESGGNISQFNGKNWHFSNDTIIASNSIIHTNMIKILSRAHK